MNDTMETITGCGSWLLLILPFVALGYLIQICNKCNKREPKKESQYVFVCTGDYAHAYHTKQDCEGIESCAAEIIKISIDSAINMGRTPCHYCDETYKPTPVIEKFYTVEIKELDDGEYIDVEDVVDYVSEHYTKSEIIDMFGIELSDFEPFESEYDYDYDEPYAPSRVR